MSGKDMSKSDASRIQSSQAKGGSDMSSGGFAARAQSAGDRNANQGGGTSHGTVSGGGNNSTGGGAKASSGNYGSAKK